MKYKKKDGLIQVLTPRSEEFNSKVKRNLHGKWNEKERAWEIREEFEDGLLNLLKSIFGYNPYKDTGETVSVRYNAEDFRIVDGRRDYISLGGILIAKRYSRDGEVSLNPSTFIVDGDFDERGGSAGYPRIDSCKEVTLQTILPKQIYDSLSKEMKEKLRVIEVEDRIAALAEIRKNLQEQIQKIDEEIKNLDK